MNSSSIANSSVELQTFSNSTVYLHKIFSNFANLVLSGYFFLNNLRSGLFFSERKSGKSAEKERLIAGYFLKFLIQIVKLDKHLCPSETTLSLYKPVYIYIYLDLSKGYPEPGPTISPDPDFRPSPGPLFVEDLTARVVRAQPPASGLLAGIKLNSLVSNLGGACQIEILQFRQGGGGGRWGR